MNHIAYMKKSLGFLPKIISGEKTIESRWYTHRARPWNGVAKGDVVYFKNSGEMIYTQAIVSQLLQYESLTPKKIKEILELYGKGIGFATKKEQQVFYEVIKHKNYCILIFLKDVKQIKPFTFDKTGFGNMSAWVTLQNT